MKFAEFVEILYNFIDPKKIAFDFQIFSCGEFGIFCDRDKLGSEVCRKDIAMLLFLLDDFLKRR